MRIRYEITTPAFTGDAKQTNCLIRPPSLKGLLRFWWRTLHGDITDPQKLFDLESKIFGSTDTGQGVRITPVSVSGNAEPVITDFKPGPITYLGYGLMDYKGRTYVKKSVKPGESKSYKKKETDPRYSYDSGVKFDFEIMHKDPSLLNEVAKAALLLGIVGGIGARTRRGFGSLSIIDCDSDEIKKQISKLSSAISIDDYKKRLTEVLKWILPTQLPSGEPEFTSWSDDPQILIWNTAYNQWDQALESVGRAFSTVRKSYGKDLDLEKKADYKPGPDYMLMTEYLRTNELEVCPERVAFGLPHNYFFRSGKFRQDKISVKLFPIDPAEPSVKDGRRASPVFIHIAKFKDSNGRDKYVPVLLYLPSRFLPERYKILVKCREYKNQKVDPPSSSIILQWLESLTVNEKANGPVASKLSITR